MATIPARTASGSFGQTATTWARSWSLSSAPVAVMGRCRLLSYHAFGQERNVSTSIRHLRVEISVVWTRFASSFLWTWGPALRFTHIWSAVWWRPLHQPSFGASSIHARERANPGVYRTCGFDDLPVAPARRKTHAPSTGVVARFRARHIFCEVASLGLPQRTRARSPPGPSGTGPSSCRFSWVSSRCDCQ